MPSLTFEPNIRESLYSRILAIVRDSLCPTSGDCLVYWPIPDHPHSCLDSSSYFLRRRPSDLDDDETLVGRFA